MRGDPGYLNSLDIGLERSRRFGGGLYVKGNLGSLRRRLAERVDGRNRRAEATPSFGRYAAMTEERALFISPTPTSSDRRDLRR